MIILFRIDSYTISLKYQVDLLLLGGRGRGQALELVVFGLCLLDLL